MVSAIWIPDIIKLLQPPARSIQCWRPRTKMVAGVQVSRRPSPWGHHPPAHHRRLGLPLPHPDEKTSVPPKHPVLNHTMTNLRLGSDKWKLCNPTKAVLAVSRMYLGREPCMPMRGRVDRSVGGTNGAALATAPPHSAPRYSPTGPRTTVAPSEETSDQTRSSLNSSLFLVKLRLGATNKTFKHQQACPRF